MITDNDVPRVIALVRDRLDALRAEGRALLQVEERDYKVEDEWLYVVVAPSRPGIRASEYAQVMVDVEQELRETEGGVIDNVLLIPAIPD